MQKPETIGEFVSNLEKTFDPNETVDLNVNTLRFLHFSPNKTKITETCSSEWMTKDEDWDVLLIESGTTKVSDVITCLKYFLPKHTDDLMAMVNKNGYYCLFSSSVTVKKFALDPDQKYMYIKRHPRIIKHNQTFVNKDFWIMFNTKMDQYAKAKFDDSQAQLKYARYVMLDYKILNPDFELPTPYFYLNKFYQTLEDVTKADPQVKDLKFCLSKGIMVVDVTPVEAKLYFIGSDSFTMEQIVQKYTLTETQLIKFFVEDDSKFRCTHPEILKTFEK